MFTNAIKLFSINKFDIKVDPSWLIIAALVTWSLSQQFFPDALPGRSPQAYLAMAIIAMLGLFASLLLHELAHSVVARHLGVPIKSITLFLFGGVAELEAEPKSGLTEFWISIAGPLMSLALAVGFWSLSGAATLIDLPPALISVLFYLALINLVLAVFNMVPAFPLDGGRVLRAYLWHRSGDVLASTRTAARSGIFFAYFLMAFGIAALFQGAIFTGLWQIMIGGFVLIAARATYTSQLSKSVFEGHRVQALMTRDPITAHPDMTLAAFVNQIMLHHSLTFVPVTEGSVLLGHIDGSVLSGIDRENWASTRVGDVFVGLHDEDMVSPKTLLSDLMERIGKTGKRKFMVVEGHQLLGVITLSDLTACLNQTAQSLG
ncbi:site-2 protease family protein [Sulfitobacter aestuariivivens]|uniref:Zinc metalloprotease n=1 Tax=Sulfitobacter aestuariivivens TaxID=2766981 RepID=A0A927D7W4_9RHOB|nr:site-2 protease family protein [Sulfitobacter aestuariivivens]MBD3665414.1 site-2 protease family protein [Sulfitobacter aestuariivivens]